MNQYNAYVTKERSDPNRTSDKMEPEEEAREIIGLFLIGVWMVVLVILPVNFERKSNDRIHYK